MSTVNITNYPNTLNVLDKLNSDTFNSLPHDKVQNGGVIQVAHNIILTSTESGVSNEAETSSSSFQQTFLECDIKPRFTNSAIIVQMSFAAKASGTGSYHQFDLRRQIGDLPFTSVNYTNTNGIARWNADISSNGAAYYHMNIDYVDRPQTQQPMTYRLYHRNTSGNYTVRVGENSQRAHMLIWEIKHNDT